MFPPICLLAVQGITYPIVRFFTESQVYEVADPILLVRLLEKELASNLMERLYIEAFRPFERPPDLRQLDVFEDVSWYGTSQFDSIYNDNKPYMYELRRNLDHFISGPAFKIEPVGFSVNEAVFRVRNEVDGYLHYNDGWSKYWQAYDGAKEIPVRIANHNSKAVFLKKGDHHIRFVFNPIHYRLSLAAYYFGLFASLMIISVCIYGLRRTTLSEKKMTGCLRPHGAS